MASDALTDLTDGAAPVEGNKNKGGKTKKTKKSKENNSGEPKVKREKKGGAGGIIILMVLVIVVLVGGFGAAVFFNALGARTAVAGVVNDPLIDLVVWLDPAFLSVDDRLRAEAAARSAALDARELEIESAELEIAARETAIESQEAQMVRRDNEITHREQQVEAMLERALPLHRRDMTEAEMEEMLSLSNTYTQMAPEVAAEIMIELHDPRDVAGLLFFMSERNRAAIMAVFEPNFAAHITEILLYY